MFKTKTNKGLLIIGTLLMMLVMAFVPAVVSLSTPSVHAEASIITEINNDQTQITITVKGKDGTITLEDLAASVKEGEDGGSVTAGTFSPKTGEPNIYVATITVTNPDKIGRVEITFKVDGVTKVESVTINIEQLEWYKGTVQPIIKILGTIVPILLTLVGTAGAIFIVILSVNYSKAEDAGKREEAKKRLIGTIIGVVLMIALLIVVTLFTNYAPSIIKWIKGL